MATSDRNGYVADTLIIGAGLSGLACAVLLAEAGQSVLVIEARAAPGGRIRSVVDTGTGSYLADLGPTWIWPEFQPLISRWISKLDARLFAQFDQGQAIFDHGEHNAPQRVHLPGQYGSERIAGGPQVLIDALAHRLPDGAIRTGSIVTNVAVQDTHATVRIAGLNPTALIAARVIVATPPRIAATTIEYQPELPPPLIAALEHSPTWMAQHAKMVALYDIPFWRSLGLSGRIASQSGPIVEAHEHSGPDGDPAALFGFIGWPHHMRNDQAVLEAGIRSQLQRCFGADSPEPRRICIEDWASDPLVTTPRDLSEPMSHPEIGPAILRQPQFGGRLWFAGSETATQSPGLIEGAFSAAETTIAAILDA